MVGYEHVATKLANDHIGEIAARTALRAEKLRRGIERLPPSGANGFSTIDATDSLGLSAEGFRSIYLTPKQYADEPELFSGPFMQLGTYLGIGPEWLQLTLDVVFDPTNLIIPGLGGALTKLGVEGLTNAGRIAKITSTLAEAARAGGAAGKTGAEIISEAERAFEAIGKLSKVGAETVRAEAAKGSRSFGKFVKSALATGEVSEDLAPVLEVFRKNRGALAGVIENSAKIAEYGELPGQAFLQTTTRARVATGQINPLVRVAKPVNPLKQPLKFTRQIAGFHVAGDDIFLPTSALFAKGVDRVGLGTLASSLPEGGTVQALLSAEDALTTAKKDAFKSAAFKSGDVTPAHLRFNIEAARAAAGYPIDRAFVDTNIGALSDDVLKARYNELSGRKADAAITDAASFDRYKDRVTQALVRVRSAEDSALVAQRNIALAESMARIEHDAATYGLDDALLQSWPSALRQIMDLSSARSLAADAAIGPGNAIASRVTLGNLLGQQVAITARDITRRLYPKRASRELMDEVLARMTEHPEFWEQSAEGRWKLRQDAFEALSKEGSESSSPFFRELVNRARTSERDAGLINHLLVEGVSDEFMQTSLLMRSYLDDVGSQLVDEGILFGFQKDYFPHVFKPNKAFFDRFGGSHVKESNFFESMIAATEADQSPLSDIVGKMSVAGKRAMASAKSGKLSFQEARVLTEEMAVALERAKLGEYERDAMTLFGRYVGSVNSAVAMQRLFRDLPDMSPGLTRSLLESRFGSDRLGGVTDEMISRHKRIMRTQPEGPLAFAYERPITGRAELPDDELRLSSQALQSALDKTVRQEGPALVREVTGKRLQGVTEIGGFKLIDSRTGERVGFDPAWLDSEVPGWVVGSRRVKALVESEVKAAEIRSAIESAVTGEWLARVEKYGSAASAKAAKAEATANLAALRAREAVARRLHGAKSVAGYEFLQGGKIVPIQDEWVLLGSIPEGVTVRKRSGGKATKAEARKSISALVAGEKGSEAIRAAVNKEIGKIEESVVVQKAKAIAEQATVEAKADKARSIVAKRFAGQTSFHGHKLIGADGKPVAIKAEWILNDAYPEGLKGLKAFRSEMDEFIRAEGLKTRLVTESRTDRKLLAARARTAVGEPAASNAQKVWVYKDDYGHLSEVFRLYRTGEATSEIARKYDALNHALKGTVLLGDIFHYNVLAFGQMVADAGGPLGVLSRLRDESGALLAGVREGGFSGFRPGAALTGAAVGAVGGAAAGAGLGADPGEILTFSAAGALYGATLGAARANARLARNLSLNPQHLDSLVWMGLGGWSGRPDDRSIGVAQRALTRLADALRGSPAEMLVSPIEGTRHLLDAWDHELWGVMHNGTKHYYFDTRWRALLPKLEASREFGEGFLKKRYEDLVAKGDALVKRPNGATKGFRVFVDEERHRLKADLARQLVQSSNNAFGGQSFRFLFEQPEMVRGLRRVLLSPDWTSSRLALGASWFMALDTKTRAALGAGIGTAVEAAEMGFDPNEDSFPWRGLGFGAGMGVALGRWSDSINRRLITKGDVLAKEARRMAGVALAGGYVMLNALNYAFNGHFMWDNEEGKRLSLQIPGETAQGKSRFVTLGKSFLEPLEFAGVTHADKFPIPVVGRLGSKLAVGPRAAINLIDNKTIFGPIAVGSDSPAEVAGKLVSFGMDLTTPIIAQGPLRALAGAATGDADAREFAAAAIRFAGFNATAGKAAGLDDATIASVLRTPSYTPSPLLGGETPLINY